MDSIIKEIESICKNSDKKKMLNDTNSYEVMYQLSKAREFLLDWYEFQTDGCLLEIGGGCGSLSRMFAHKLRKVVSLEEKQEYAAINRRRNEKEKNLSVLVGKVDSVSIKEKFDYVTLIGTLEEASLYIDEECSDRMLLEWIRKNALKDEGKLILAIDNKTGMKYWAGAVEKYTQEAFGGINNKTEMYNKKMYSKQQVIKLLKETGYGEIQCYYPMPDYRFPTVIYSDDFLPQVGELQNLNKDYYPNSYRMFEESLAYDTVCEDGEFPYFANSILIVANTMICEE